MSALSYPLNSLPRTTATMLGTTPTAKQLSDVIALESAGQQSSTRQYLAVHIPLLVLPHPDSGIPCSGSLNIGTGIGSLVGAGASIPSPASPFLAIGGGLVSELSGLFSGPSGEQKAEAPILCNGYLAMNQAFQSLDQQFQLGQLSITDYFARLDLLQQQWNNLLAPVNPPGTDSAANRYARMADAFIRLRKQIAPQVAPIGDNVSMLARSITSTPTGVPIPAAATGLLSAPLGGFTFSPTLIAIIAIAVLLFLGVLA